MTVLNHVTIVAASEEAGRIRHDRDDRAPIHGSHLLVATGRRPRLERLGLEQAGVEVARDGIVVDEDRRTTNKASSPSAIAAQDPASPTAAVYESALVVASIDFGLQSRARLNLMPSVTLHSAGNCPARLTEDQARSRNLDVRMSCASALDNDRAVTEGDTAGFVKLVRVGHRVVGVTIVGANAGNLLLPCSLSLRGKSGRWSLANEVVAYPTRSELSKAAAFTRFEPWIFGTLARQWARPLAVTRVAEKLSANGDYYYTGMFERLSIFQARRVAPTARGFGRTGWPVSMRCICGARSLDLETFQPAVACSLHLIRRRFGRS